MIRMIANAARALLPVDRRVRRAQSLKMPVQYPPSTMHSQMNSGTLHVSVTLAGQQYSPPKHE